MLHCIIIMEIKYKRILRKVVGEFTELFSAGSYRLRSWAKAKFGRLAISLATQANRNFFFCSFISNSIFFFSLR